MAPVLLTAVPHEHSRLSNGVLVRASVLARVLGLRLLTLDATITLAPARVRAVATADDRVSADARTSARGPLPRSGADHRCLAEAVRRMDEGRELLDRTSLGGP